METAATTHEVIDVSADGDLGVDAFFATLRNEQARFLDAVGRARSRLGNQSGQLAHVTAIQAQLTRQFFDAQRSILKRRSEVDAEVALIANSAEENAGGFADVHPSSYDDIAALGVAVIHTVEEADSLSSVIDDAFEPDEPDGAAAQRQLARLLDDWWRAENQDGQAVIDAARARAAVRQHIAGIEAGEVANAGPAPALTSRVVAALGSTDRAYLGSLLSTLANSLDLPPATGEQREERSPEKHHDDTVIALGSAATGPDDLFRRFWDPVMASWSR